MKKTILISAAFIFTGYGSLVMGHGDDRVCSTVLTTSAFNQESAIEVRKILFDQYENICNSEFDTLKEATNSARSSGLAVGFKGFSLGASDAKELASGKYSYKASRYCREFRTQYDLQTSSEHYTQNTDMALSVWKSCIDNVYSNQLYATFSESSDGKSLTGTLFRSVGSVGGYGTVEDFSFSPDDVQISCSIGGVTFSSQKNAQTSSNERAEKYRLVSNPTNFSCTKDPAKTVSVSIETDQGHPPWFTLRSKADVDLEEKLKKALGERNEFFQANQTLREQNRSLNERLANSAVFKPDTSTIGIHYGSNRGATFIVNATPHGDGTITVKVVAPGERGESSCLLNGNTPSDVVSCRISMNIAAPDINTSFHADGTMSLVKSHGAIKYTGSLIIADVGQVNYHDSTILTVR